MFSSGLNMKKRKRKQKQRIQEIFAGVAKFRNPYKKNFARPAKFRKHMSRESMHN